MSAFADLLRRHREAKRWSLEYLGGCARLDTSLISRLESARRNPTAHSISKLVAALGLGDHDADALWLAAGLVPPGLEPDLVAQAVALIRTARKRRLSDLLASAQERAA